MNSIFNQNYSDPLYTYNWATASESFCSILSICSQSEEMGTDEIRYNCSEGGLLGIWYAVTPHGAQYWDGGWIHQGQVP